MAGCLGSASVSSGFAQSTFGSGCARPKRRFPASRSTDLRKRKAQMQLTKRIYPQQKQTLVICASSDGVEVDQEVKGSILPSGEWPENFSILNFEDLSKHYEPTIFKAEAQPSAFLADVMSRIMYTASSEDLLEDVDQHFAHVSGLPVVDENFRCVGVLSKKDRMRASKGLKSKVGEVMSSPAITLSADRTVSDAAVLMLKNKIHRIPIVNESQQIVGMCTRTDIFTAMEGGP